MSPFPAAVPNAVRNEPAPRGLFDPVRINMVARQDSAAGADSAATAVPTESLATKPDGSEGGPETYWECTDPENPPDWAKGPDGQVTKRPVGCPSRTTVAVAGDKTRRHRLEELGHARGRHGRRRPAPDRNVDVRPGYSGYLAGGRRFRRRPEAGGQGEGRRRCAQGRRRWRACRCCARRRQLLIECQFLVEVRVSKNEETIRRKCRCCATRGNSASSTTPQRSVLFP